LDDEMKILESRCYSCCCIVLVDITPFSVVVVDRLLLRLCSAFPILWLL